MFGSGTIQQLIPRREFSLFFASVSVLGSDHDFHKNMNLILKTKNLSYSKIETFQVSYVVVVWRLKKKKQLVKFSTGEVTDSMVTQTNYFKFKGKLNIPIMKHPSQPKRLNLGIYCS